MVRETLAITAYTTGDYALALRELRTYRRISGRDDQIALMVDSERGLGRPDRALELGRSVDESKLDTNGKVQLAIAMSGARLDQGNAELALAELEIPQLDRTKAFSYSPALFGAYAAVLADLGRDKEAAVWESAAELAQNALDESQEGFETVEFVTEPNPDYIPPEEPEAPDDAEDSEDSEDAEDKSSEESPDSEESFEDDDEADEGEAAVAEAEAEVVAIAVEDVEQEAVDASDDAGADEAPEGDADEATGAAVLDDDEFTRASVSEQVEAEFAEILAEIDEATEAEAEEAVVDVADAVEVVDAEQPKVEVEETAEGVEETPAADVETADDKPADKPDATDDDEDDEQLSLFDL
jgi:hypothetical protein